MWASVVSDIGLSQIYELFAILCYYDGLLLHPLFHTSDKCGMYKLMHPINMFQQHRLNIFFIQPMFNQILFVFNWHATQWFFSEFSSWHSQWTSIVFFVYVKYVTIYTFCQLANISNNREAFLFFHLQNFMP